MQITHSALIIAVVSTLTASALTPAVSAQSTPQMTRPTPGATLAGSSVTFSWEANGTAVNRWWLYIGTTLGANDIKNSGSLTATTYAATGLPTTGAAVYVRLWYNTGSWAYVDYPYWSSPGDAVSCPCFTAVQLNTLYDQLVGSQGKKVTDCMEQDYSASQGYPAYTYYYIEACVGGLCDTTTPTVVASVGASHPYLSGNAGQVWSAGCSIQDTKSNKRYAYEANLRHRELAVCGDMLRSSKWGQDVTCK
jgi:hypothetical protein